MNLSNTNEEMEAEVFSALAHPERLNIIALLKDGEACVCHIQSMLGKRQAYISQHLTVLKNAGLVTTRKDGLRVYYQISDPRWHAVIDQCRSILASDKYKLPSKEENTKQPCNCPQCVSKREEKIVTPKEMSYA